MTEAVYHIATIRTYNLTARIIHFGMWLWYVLRGKKPRATYNHAEVILGEYTYGAIGHGVRKIKWKDYIHNGKRKKVRIYPVFFSSQLHVELVRNYLENAIGTPYEFENFLEHGYKIFFGKWIGSRDDKELYCYEFAIKALNLTYPPGNKLNPYMNPAEFEEEMKKRNHPPYDTIPNNLK